MSTGKSREITYTHKHIGERFKHSLDFNPQYFHIYRARLASLKPKALLAAPSEGLSELTQLKLNKEEIVAGIVIRRHKERTSIIQYYISYLDRLEDKENYFSEEDEILLEDESGRIKLNLTGIRVERKIWLLE